MKNTGGYISGTYWFYAAITTIGMIFLSMMLPETKGKSLEEVEGLFAESWCAACDQSSEPTLPINDESVQYVHIRGLNRDGQASDIESPE